MKDMDRINRTPLRRDERGMALVLSLIAIIVIGVLVGGTIHAGRMEIGAGRSAVTAAQAQEQAEQGLADAFVNWDGTWNGLATGASSTAPVVTDPSGYNQYETTVTKLGGNLFQVTTVGSRIGGGGQVLSTRSLGMLARLFTPDIDVDAAVTANAQVTVSGNTTRVDGNDTNPPDWEAAGDCPAVAPGAGVYGIRTSDDVRQNGSPDIYGVPDATIENDTTVTAGMFNDTFAMLAAMASITIDPTGDNPATIHTLNPLPVTTGVPARCDKTHVNGNGDGDNWGEPWRDPPTVASVSECEGFFPVVYYPGPGTVKMLNGRAQGIVISAGSIDIAGNFEFTGIILALGSVSTHGTGNKVTGAVLSGNADINDDDVIAGTPTILYSSCVIQMVLAGTAKGVPLSDRSWSQRW
jgi:hypothetical protein